jgi:hypothetical protein
MIYFIRKVAVTGVISAVVFSLAIYMANSIDFVSAFTKGQVGALLNSGGAFLGIYAVATFYILFAAGAIITGIIRTVTRFGIWSAFALLAVIVIVSTTAIMGYATTTTTVQARITDAMNISFTETYGDNFKAKLTDKLNELPPSELSKVTQQTGLSQSQIQSMIDSGQYAELVKLLPEDITGIDIEQELRHHGFDPESPLIKSLLQRN